MTILHICGVENKMSNGATVAVLNHVNEQAKTDMADILALHIKDEILDWDEKVKPVKVADFQDVLQKTDLIVFHEIYYMPFFKMAKAAYKAGVPYVVIPHGGLTDGAQTQLKYAKIVVNFLWAKKYISQAAGIQFLSDRERSTSRRWNANAFISPNGVSVPETYKCNFNADEPGLRLIFIGRINLFYKGLDALAEAAKSIADEMRSEQISIDIYGPKEGDDRAKLEQMVQEADLSDVIKIHDGVFGEDKAKVMLDADAFIQPSRSEGMPMGILDAMAIGLPVIVTPGTSFDRDVLENDCGWVCDA